MSVSFTRLEYDDGKTHRKYWQVELLDTGVGFLVSAEWGKLTGGGGGTQVKVFPTEEAAKKHVEKMVAEKRRKGYAEAVTFGREAAEATAPAVVKTNYAPDAPQTAADYLSALRS